MKMRLKLARALNYRSLGTVEFLMDSQENYYFMEINPRIQVEHPVTELVTHIDLVEAQLRLAMGDGLICDQQQVRMQGWAIEARVIAEDPENGFLPSTGVIEYLKEPGGPGIRIDSAIYTGMTVSSDYDSLLAKVIAWGDDRHHAIRRLERALWEFRISGVSTDLEFLKQIINSDQFLDGQADTTYLDNLVVVPGGTDLNLEKEVALAAALMAHNSYEIVKAPESNINNFWRMTAWREQMGKSE